MLLEAIKVNPGCQNGWWWAQLILFSPVKGIDFATRKIAKMLKPQKVIKQDGDMLSIHTTSTFRDYMLQFKIGEEFEEDNKGLDNRKCKVRLTIYKLIIIKSSYRIKMPWSILLLQLKISRILFLVWHRGRNLNLLFPAQ